MIPTNTKPKLVTSKIKPSKTYRLNFDTWEITNEMIDGIEAIKQFVRLSIIIPRYRYLIYSHNIGSEINRLFGQNYSLEYLKTVVPNMITDAIIWDERIKRVHSFSVSQTDDSLYVEFTVDSIYGSADISEVFKIV